MAKTAFITGATSGIGLATAKALAEKGYNLGLAARRKEALQKVRYEIMSAYPMSVEIYPLDVRDEKNIKKVADSYISACGAPDVLVNNAGLARGLEPYERTDTDDIRQMIDTNIKGLFLVTRAFLPSMLKRNEGHIVNLGSTAGLYAYAGAAVYCATKAAVKTFSDGIRIDTIDSNLKVTTIQPGIVHTPFSEIRFHGDKKRADAVYEGIEALEAEDIADIIAFAVTRKRRVQISDIVIMANQQATGFMVSKHKK
ncbi:MAG: SDR family NAD(P)-dependent oxidoreductase [Dialister sp.]|nr:SDR family NAD(P)-dependent oxidoreductase [Dialister sp.]